MESLLTKSPEQSLLLGRSLKEIARLEPLPLSFYLGDSLQVARSLLGKGLFVATPDGAAAVEIVEVEAYLGGDDPASHAYRGPTARNGSMFGRGGTCYVYLSYGINYCMNISTREPGVGEAVLLRAGRPIAGEELMRVRRSNRSNAELTNGPGKLTQALAVDLAHDGLSFDSRALKIIDLGRRPKPNDISVSRRIGISKAVDREWRFFLKDSPYLSRRGM